MSVQDVQQFVSQPQMVSQPAPVRPVFPGGQYPPGYPQSVHPMPGGAMVRVPPGMYSRPDNLPLDGGLPMYTSIDRYPSPAYQKRPPGPPPRYPYPAQHSPAPVPSPQYSGPVQYPPYPAQSPVQTPGAPGTPNMPGPPPYSAHPATPNEQFYGSMGSLPIASPHNIVPRPNQQQVCVLAILDIS